MPRNRLREAIEDVKESSNNLREKLDAQDEALEQLDLELAIEENEDDVDVDELVFDDEDDEY